MFFQQYYLGCLSHASYLVADPATGAAAVIDPRRDVQIYLDEAATRGFRIEHVILTHFHADFLAGHIELRNRTGATIHLGRGAEAEFAFHALAEGDTVDLGGVALEVLETPGHTPEGISLVVREAGSDVPYGVLTGDTLFIGDVGRPDLLASVGVTAKELGHMLYGSVQKLLRLPDETRVYPAHGAGSLCGKNLSTETVSTMGEQRRVNYALQPMDEETFVQLVTADQPEAPPYFLHDAVLNRQERPDLTAILETGLRALSLDEVLELQESGAQVIDARDPFEFAAAHLAGSLNVGLDGEYATWAGTFLGREDPIVIVAEDGRLEEAVTRLGRIGFDHVAGYLDGGMAALEARPDRVAQLERTTVPELRGELARPGAPLVLDLRRDAEVEAGAIPGARHIPLHRLRERADELPREGRVVAYCGSGYRSSIGASILHSLGWGNVEDLVGGYNAWKATEPPAAD